MSFRDVILVALALAGCATSPAQKAEREACKVSPTYMHCRPPRPQQDHTGQIQFCDDRGHCSWVDRDELLRTVKEALGQR